jgi:hypothetical protein
MKEYLQGLQLVNKKQFALILYLWLESDKQGVYTFKILDICKMFSIPKTSLYRFLASNHKFHLMKLEGGRRVIKFAEKEELAEVIKVVKKATDSSDIEYNGRLRKFLKEFYFKHDFDYPELEKHFRYALNIMSKMDELIKVKNEVITENIRFDSFCIFFEKLPVWWTENKKLSLPTLNKNFTNILNQIKSSQNDKYSSLQQGAESIDFSDLTS